MNQIKFDPCDYDGMITLMDQYGDSEQSFFGKNEDGEWIRLSVNHDCIIAETYQKNNWTRINTYHRDGTTEETYSK